MKRTQKIRWSNILIMLTILFLSLIVATPTVKDVDSDKTPSYSAACEERALAEIVERKKRSAIKQAYGN